MSERQALGITREEVRKMNTARLRSDRIGLLGRVAMLAILVCLMTFAHTGAELSGSEDQLATIEVAHKHNIGQLHDLHHEMRATFKQLARARDHHKTAQQLAAQLQAVRQVLDRVATTEKDHPQWPNSWSHRHARLIVLVDEMEVLLTGEAGVGGHRSLDHLGRKLTEMKEILDIW